MDSLFIFLILVGLVLIFLLLIVAIWLRIQLSLMRSHQQAVADFLNSVGNAFRVDSATPVVPVERPTNVFAKFIMLSLALLVLLRLLLSLLV